MIGLLADIQLRWRLRRFRNRRAAQPANWDAVQKIALVLNKTPGLNKNETDKFIDSTGKYVEVFFVETGSKTASFADWRCFTREHKNFLGLPLRTVMKDMATHQFDIVINACGETDHFAGLIAAAIPASLKCSANNNFSAADLSIISPGSSGPLGYLAEVLHYLRMIRAQAL